ncbi:MAG: YgiQ family radical SAM protein, partial [Hyphomicrobiaceae bacterium]
MPEAKPLFSYRKHWAHRFGTARFLPTSRAEMTALGWDACDIILVTGDAYIDHPSFGMALVGRLLEAQGFRVGILSQPDWQTDEPFKALGEPALFFGVTGGNMDSMVNRYTADRRLRHNDAYTAGGEGGKRPDRSVIVYAQRCREAYPETTIVLGGIEASLRRIAHYDYWSDKVRRSILVDAKADLLLYGNAERALVEVAHRLARAKGDHAGACAAMDDVRGVALMKRAVPEGVAELHADDLDQADEGARMLRGVASVVRLPAFEQVAKDPEAYARASRVLHRESNPGNARPLVQRHGNRELWVTPPPVPLTTEEMDAVYELPYARSPHPSYEDAKIPAWEMIRFSVTIMRGCFGGCTFCSITEHEGRVIQNRSEQSILNEIENIRDRTPGFTGHISDIGGPTANMYRMACKDRAIEASCRRQSCVYPGICPNLDTSHEALISLYRKARSLPGIKKIHVASGVR